MPRKFITVWSQDLAAKCCKKECSKPLLCSAASYSRVSSDPVWYQPNELTQVFDIFSAHPSEKVKLIAGNTGRGNHVHSVASIDTVLEYQVCIKCQSRQPM